MKRAIVDTSTGCLDYYPHNYDIKILRISLYINDEHYYDGLDMKANEFYERLKKDKTILPKTSQPSPGELLEFFENLSLQGYDEAFVTTISSELSGVNNGINSIKDILKDKINIVTYDTRTVCFSEGIFALKAAKLTKEGKTMDEIKKELDKYKDNNIILFGVSDLEFLIKNGRLSNAKGFFAKMFKIKPLIKVSEGFIRVLKSIRTTNAAFEAMADEIKNYTIGYDKFFIYYAYTGNNELYEKLKKMLKKRFGNSDFLTVPGTPVVGTHVGSDALGVGIFLDYEKEDV